MRKTQTKPTPKAQRPARVREEIHEIVFTPAQKTIEEGEGLSHRSVLILYTLFMSIIALAIVMWEYAPYGEFVAAGLIAIPVSGLIIDLELSRKRGDE